VRILPDNAVWTAGQPAQHAEDQRTDDHTRPCQRFARNCAKRSLTLLDTHPFAAPLACAVVWAREVLQGAVNHRRINGKEGSPVRFRRGLHYIATGDEQQRAPALLQELSTTARFAAGAAPGSEPWPPPGI
jgi:hypothetical protein